MEEGKRGKWTYPNLVWKFDSLYEGVTILPRTTRLNIVLFYVLNKKLQIIRWNSDSICLFFFSGNQKKTRERDENLHKTQQKDIDRAKYK